MPEKANESRNKNTKRGLKVAAIAGGLVLVGGVAFAYWTQGGTGTGSAATGTTNQNLSISETTPTTAVAPGVDVPLSGTISNPNNATVHVATIDAVVSSVTPLSGQTCGVGNYAIAGGPATVNLDVTHSTPIAWSGLTLRFVESGANQDGCKGATVNITYSSN